MGKQNRYIIQDREQSSIAEAFRTLSTSIQDTQAQSNVQSVLFSSASNGEGDVMTAVNAAVTLAYSGKNVILVDCDMRRPILHELFGLNIFGVTNIIMQDKPLDQMLQESGIERLKVLTAGSVPARPVDLLSNERMKAVLDTLKTMADYVFVISAPLIVESRTIVSDACILASKVDGVVMVIDSGIVRTKTAKKAVELLNSAKANLIGMVLNEVKADEEFAYHVNAV